MTSAFIIISLNEKPCGLKVIIAPVSRSVGKSGAPCYGPS